MSLILETPPVASNGHKAPSRRPRSRAKSQVLAASNQDPIWEIRLLPTEQIGPNPFQPRQEFSEAEMEELAASVAEHGVQTPVLVRPMKPVLPEALAPAREKANTKDKRKARRANATQVTGTEVTNEVMNGEGTTGEGKEKAINPFQFELVTGERRLRACIKAGRKFIPAIVREDLTDAQAAELALVENVQRSNLNVIEEGRGYKRLMLRFRYTEARIAKKVGKSVPTVQAAIKLLELPEEVQTMLLKKQLTASHGHELLKLAAFPDPCLQVAIKAYVDKISAVSLGQNPLPNAPQLKRRGVIVELGYGTKFDWKTECKNCPFKALVSSGYGSYCLKPAEWRAKQDHALEMEKQEAARVLEAARKGGEATVAASDMPPSSYCNLRWNDPPAGCNAQCPCRGQIADPRDASQSIPICLDPERFRELQKVQRLAQEEERERHYGGLWQGAVQQLTVASPSPGFDESSECDTGEERVESSSDENPTGERSAAAVVPGAPEARHQVDSPSVSPEHPGTAVLSQALAWNKVAAILVLPALAGNHSGYYGDRNWEGLVERTAGELGIALPLDDILGQIDDGNPLRLLEGVEPSSLLLLGAAVLLRQESDHAARWGGDTPLLDFVLEMQTAQQNELEMDGAEGQEASGQEPSDQGASEAAVESSAHVEPGEVTVTGGMTQVTGEDAKVVQSHWNEGGENEAETDEAIIAMLESENSESEEF